MRARRGGVGAEDVDVDEDKSQWGRQQGGATAPGEGIQCVRALSTLRRAHRRTIKSMECVCEHYSRCVVARTASHHWGHGMCVRALFTLRRRAHCRTIGSMECVCEHYSRCVIARTAALLGAWNVRGSHIIPSLLRRRPIQRSTLVTLHAHHAPPPTSCSPVLASRMPHA